MEKQFVTYEIALALKELGFDEECLAYYDNTYKTFNLQWCRYNTHSAIKLPLWQQAIDWLLDEHDIHIYVESYYNEDGSSSFIGWCINNDFPEEIPGIDEFVSTTYEAREKAIWEAIEAIKTKNEGTSY